MNPILTAIALFVGGAFQGEGSSRAVWGGFAAFELQCFNFEGLPQSAEDLVELHLVTKEVRSSEIGGENQRSSEKYRANMTGISQDSVTGSTRANISQNFKGNCNFKCENALSQKNRIPGRLPLTRFLSLDLRFQFMFPLEIMKIWGV